MVKVILLRRSVAEAIERKRQGYGGQRKAKDNPQPSTQ